jgi:hypothetical protein
MDVMFGEHGQMSSRVLLTSLVKLNNDQISASIDGEVVILSVERGAYFGLDQIGSEIWQLIETPVRVDVLCDELAAKYDADRPTIEHDVLALLESLVAEELVVVE